MPRPAAILLCLLVISPCASLRLPGIYQKQLYQKQPTHQQPAKQALFSALCAVALIVTPTPSLAATLNEAIIDVSESSYPVIKALRTETFGPFSEKIGKLILDINPDKLGKSVELAVDVFNSVPAEKLDALNSAAKEAFDGLSVDSCTLVPLPSVAVASKFGALAAEKVSPSKLEAFGAKWSPTLKALPKTESAICLPPVDKLDALALAQADIGRAFGAEESGRFATYTAPLLKSSLSIGKVLPLVSDAKKLTPTATPKELAAFQAAGKRIEAASKAEAQRVRLEQNKERAAAIAAAKAAGQPVPAAAAGSPGRNAVQEEELAAAREAAAKEAKAKKQAAVEEAARRREEFAEAEATRVAALKAKAAAIAAAKEEAASAAKR